MRSNSQDPSKAIEGMGVSSLDPEVYSEEVDGVPVNELAKKASSAISRYRRPATVVALAAGVGALLTITLSPMIRKRRKRSIGDIVASRSLLLDVHLLDRK